MIWGRSGKFLFLGVVSFGTVFKIVNLARMYFGCSCRVSQHRLLKERSGNGIGKTQVQLKNVGKIDSLIVAVIIQI